MSRTKNEDNNFGDRVRHLIDSQCAGNISEFGRRLGSALGEKAVSDSTVQQWINLNPRTGRCSKPRGVRYDVVCRAIAAAFDVEYSWVSQGEPQQHSKEKAWGVPLLDVYVGSGGSGASVSETKERYLSVPSRVAPFANSKKLKAMFVVGDSMSGFLEDRDTVLVDVSDTEIKDGVFVISFDGAPLVKRLQRISAKKINLISENKAYPVIEVDLESSNFRVLGRVVGKIQGI